VHRGTKVSLCALLEQAGFIIVKAIEGSFQMRYLDGSALFNHNLTKRGFLDGWRGVVNPENESDVFARLEARLNEQAAINGELRMTILCCIWRDRSRDDSRSCCTKRRISSSGQFKRRKDNRIAPTEINFTCCSNIGMLQKAVKLVRIRG
jgi:hypothetical protein